MPTDPLSLIEAQFLFSRCLGQLLVYADESGSLVTMGECYRSPEEAARLHALGAGIRNSNHCKRLAVDLLCWRLKHGEWIWLRDGTEPEYRILGNKWKSLSKFTRWGGDFITRPDPGHFSVEWEGVC